MRNNVELVVAALVFTCALRTFVAQPISIPTGSMQPTLYGIRVERYKSIDGDHVMVNRIGLNFRPPERGDIIVFRSEGIDHLNGGEIYIKRLIATGGDRVWIGDDRRVRINDEAIDSSQPGFENLYAFDPEEPPMESRYSGHVNQRTADLYGGPENLAPLFMTADYEFEVSPGHVLVFGDNTMVSQDSRFFGEIPIINIIGKAGPVYWPISGRFGKTPK